MLATKSYHGEFEREFGFGFDVHGTAGWQARARKLGRLPSTKDGTIVITIFRLP
jgi:hypothetical protein